MNQAPPPTVPCSLREARAFSGKVAMDSCAGAGRSAVRPGIALLQAWGPYGAHLLPVCVIGALDTGQSRIAQICPFWSAPQ